MTPEKRLEQIPDMYDGAYRKNYKKAMQGKSLRTAVNCFCLECTGYEKQYITTCTDSGCPLFPYRPYKPAKPCATAAAAM